MTATAVGGSSSRAPGRIEPARRLFFALWPDPPTLARGLAEVQRRVPRGSGRPQRADQLHLTVEFLGSVPEARLGDVLEVGRVAAAGASCCTLVLDATEHWRRPQVLCLTASVVPPPLLALVEALRAELAARGFEPERRAFRPHLTLARKVRRPPPATGVEPFQWPVSELTLVESTTDPTGSRYERLQGWPLGG